MERSIQANGITHIADKDAPSRTGAPATLDANAIAGSNKPAIARVRVEITLDFKKVNTALDSFIQVVYRPVQNEIYIAKCLIIHQNINISLLHRVRQELYIYELLD